jgi:DNA primase catalytic core
MISNKIIEKLLALDIHDVVGDYNVELKKSGVNWKGLCPFHNDTTPSFVVSPAKNICHCFSCGEGGNPISFVMKKENCSFIEACKILGDKYHIKVEEEEDRKPTKEELELRQKKESSFIIYEHVQKHFVSCLHQDTPEAKAAYSYAVGRWGAQEVEELGIGYAPKDWKDIIDFAKKEGLSIPLMKELHLISTSEKGNDYGFYNDRLMIPIRDKYGRIISYTARTMDEHKEKGSKYMIGAESFFFSKGYHLFGLDTAQKEGAKQELFYVVEGAPDVIKMQEIGVTNTIAPLGTAFTKEQLQLLKRYHCSLCFIPDQDVPGIEAVKKNGRLAMEAGFRVAVKEIPPYVDEEGVEHKQDADSYFQKKNQVEEIKSEDFVIWLMQESTQRAILERTASMQLNINTFGINGGFSSIQSVNERIFPTYYRNLLGNIPAKNAIQPPPAFPIRWNSFKERVVIPYLQDATNTNKESKDVLPLENRITSWLMQFD